MRISILILFLVVPFLIAAQPLFLSNSNVNQASNILPISTDVLIYTQPYSFGFISGGACIFGGSYGRWLCDDFVLESDCYISEIYIWILWTGEQASHMNLVISEDILLDWDPNTNIDVWAESVPCTNTFTGDSLWGYDIYEVHCVIDIDVYPELYAEKHYYFEIQPDVSDPCHIPFSPNFIGDYCWYNDGSGVWIRSDIAFGMPSDMFFDFYGEPVNALEPETWGSIKTLF